MAYRSRQQEREEKSTMKFKHITYYLYLITAILLHCSCQPHDPFCLHHSHGVVIVEYDWTEAPDAHDIDGTRVYFYRSDDGSNSFTTTFSGMNGGKIYIDSGNYNVVAYNNDTEKLIWRGQEAISQLETYTRSASLTEELPGYTYEHIDNLVLTPDRLWSGRIDNVNITTTDTTIITIKPQKQTYEVIWQVTGIRGANRVSACAVSITNVGGSLLIDGYRPNNNESVISGIGRHIGNKNNDKTTGGFNGRFETFGCNFNNDCRHIFSIYCWSAGGNIKASYDVTNQFHVIHNDKKIYINIDADFEIPNNGENQGGFNPEVGNWGEINQDLYI